MHRNSLILGWLITLLCVTVFLWSASLAFLTDTVAHRTPELDKVSETLRALSSSLPKASTNLAFVDSTIQNLRIATEGAVMVEVNALRFVSLLALIACFCSGVLLLSRDTDHTPVLNQDKSVELDEESEQVLTTLEQSIDDLTRACQELESTDHAHLTQGKFAYGLVEAQFDQIVRIESHLQRLRGDMTLVLSGVKDIADKMQRLSTQSEDNSHFASATRLEWNAMGSKLRQIKEYQDKIKGTSDKISRQQHLCSEIIVKTLDFGSVHAKHSENAREHVTRMNEVSRETLNSLDVLVGTMEESDQDVTTASQLVRGLSDRAEEIVNIIDVIDDIAEQTNQLALNASIEAARAGEQGQGFAVVAGEVRNLAARSSTATKSITDLLGTIQAEADHASTCLEKSKRSVEVAHTRMLEVDRSYREAVALSRQALSEINQMINDVNLHMIDLKALEKQAHEVRKFYSSFNNLLDEQGRLSSVTYSESNQLTVHSDRLSRLLSRQYFEISHCDRLINSNFFALENIKGRIEEGAATSDNLRIAFHQMYVQGLQSDPQKSHRSGKIQRISQLLRSVQKNIEVLRAPNAVIKSDLAKLLDGLEESLDASIRDKASQKHNLSAPLVANEPMLDHIPPEEVMVGSKSSTQKVS